MNRAERRKFLNRWCSCQSGKKYKNCCLLRDVEEREREIKKSLERALH